jgi:hypothetical protein
MKDTQEVFSETLKELGFANHKPSQMTNSDYWLCTDTAMERFADQFKQKWISVEDGLPEIVETNEWEKTNGHSKTVPVIEQGNLYFGWYNYQLEVWQVLGRSGSIQVSKWFNLPDNE